MPLKITNPQNQVAVLNRWADSIETKLRQHSNELDNATHHATSPANLTNGGGGVVGILGTQQGGTGTGSLLPHNLFVGNGPFPILQIPPIKLGYALTDNGPSSNPSFQPNSGFRNIIVTSIAYVALSGDIILCDTSGGGFTITYPLSSSVKSLPITVKKISSDVNPITLTPSGSDTIDGDATKIIIVSKTSIDAVADGTSTWEIV